MLITKTLEITISGYNIKHYNKFYDCEIGDTINVDIELLGESYRKEKVKVKCDYCGDEYITSVGSLNRIRKTQINKKHSCKKCLSIKRKETNMLKYGVDNPMKVEDFKNNLKNTILEKYGTENVFQSEEIKEKSRKTIKEKYGVDHIMHLQEVKDIVIEKSRKTLAKNNAIATSKQQKYLHKFYGGILNYPIDKVVLDIAFPDDKIYIEYNGSGHDLSVKFGRESQEEFDTKERKRFHFLRSRGWKLFLINSPRDYLPSEEWLEKEFKNAKNYFKQGKSRYTISLEDKIQSEKYGTMRTIR